MNEAVWSSIAMSEFDSNIWKRNWFHLDIYMTCWMDLVKNNSPILDFLVIWFLRMFVGVSVNELFWFWSIVLMLNVLTERESSFFKGESPNSWGVSDDRRSHRIFEEVDSVSQSQLNWKKIKWNESFKSLNIIRVE